jgi:pyruvate dehydrogenase E2 component (dihydrolipoamide acetyltransferase)
MAFEFRLPDIGEGVAQGEVVHWHVKVGDAIKEDQPLVSVLTDKANVEIPSPRTGRIAALHAKEGEVVKVGGLLVTIETAEASAAAAPSAHAPPPSPAPSPATPAGGVAASSAPSAPADRALATPAVRRKAREMGIDLGRVKGTGPGGRITETDLEAFSRSSPPSGAPAPGPTPAHPAPATPAAPTGPATSPAPPSGESERIPLRGVRRIIFEHMAEAQKHSALFTYVEELDVSELVRFRERSRKKLEEKGVTLTYLPFIMKAVVQGLKAHPRLNAHVDEETQELIVYRRHHLGIALAGPEGLLVPVVRDVGTKSIPVLARELQDLSERGRQGKLTREELTGSTFTITSLGALGGLLATPIVNYPEVAILGVHRMVKRPVYLPDGSIGPATLMNLSVSFDHRLLDGITAAEFLAVVKSHLEDPHQLLLELS